MSTAHDDHAREIPLHRARARGAFLLPGFAELLLGYGDRRASRAPAYAERIVTGGNGIYRPTVLRDGQVVGTF